MKKIFLLFVFALIGCTSEIFLTKDNDGQIIKTDISSQITINLDENPTTGYQWKFEITNEKNQIVEENKDIDVQSSYEQTIKDPRIAGAGGIKTLRVKFKNIGKYQIKGVYERSWEKDSAIDEVQYKIYIK